MSEAMGAFIFIVICAAAVAVFLRLGKKSRKGVGAYVSPGMDGSEGGQYTGGENVVDQSPIKQNTIKSE
jgi:hypothetical protein